MKLKKLLASILCVAMVLSTMSFSVFAADATTAYEVGFEKTYATLQDALDAAENAREEKIVINLYQDDTLDASSWQTLAMGADNTTSITINGNNNTLTFNLRDSDCSHVTTNNNAKFILNNINIESSGYNSGHWKRYGVHFACETEMNNVTSDVMLGFKANANLNNVTITESKAGYSIWLWACGQEVTIDGLTVETSTGRGIKIGDEDADEQAVTLSLSNATFSTAEKSAILVSSAYGADITVDNVDISGVAADSNNLVWIDKDWIASYDTVDLTGGSIGIESNLNAVALIGTTTYTDLATAMEAANDGDVVDLLGGTIVLKDTGVTTVPINKNITIKNGTFDITDFEAAHRNSIFDIYGGAEVTFEDVNFTGSNYSSSYGVIYAHETSKVTLNDCDFNLENEIDAVTGAVLKGNDYANDTFVVNNCDFTLNDTSRVFALMTIDMNGGSINATHKPISKEHAFRDVYGTIDDATISFDNFQNGIKNTANASLTFTNSTVTSTNMNEYDLQLAGGATVSGVAFEKTNCEATVSPAVTTFANTAAIGTTYYATLEDAFAAAQEGEVITLLANAAPTLAVDATVTKATTIDLNGKTLTINSYNLHFGKMTFKNGTINVGAINASGDGVFWQWDPDPLTFDNVTLNANEVTSTYLISENYGSDINIINGSVINVNPQKQQKLIVFCFNGGGSLLVDNSEINISNVDGKGILYGEITIKGDSKVNIATTKEGIQLTQDAHSLKIEDNAVVTVENPTDTEKTRNAIQLAAGSAYSKADTATVNASIYRAPAADGSNLADEVKLTFEPTDKQEVYNIYVETKDAEQTINRLSAVQVKFELDNPKMSYTLAPATDLGVTLTNDLDDEKAYVFNFNGEDAADATGVKLLIGTVTFGGYGGFNFKVDKNFNNKIKTAQTTDNIVEEYVPTPDAANEKQGTFDIVSSAITGAEVVEAKRDVKVVIDFNNDITAENDADYNDMTVTLTGSNGEEWIGYVGSAPTNDDPDDKVLYFENTAEKAEMTFNVTAGYRYTVVVKGEGYRTARYSTNVDASDDALVLTFWNNAKADENNNPVLAYIEDGEARSLKDVTFLAGDIAQDNIIDKYDLAAVVSYFGFDNLKTTNPNYVKYDLNRDGKIDADDISYVLVSWGK